MTREAETAAGIVKSCSCTVASKNMSSMCQGRAMSRRPKSVLLIRGAGP